MSIGILLPAVLVFIVEVIVAMAVTRLWWLTPLASNWGSIDTTLVVTLVITGLSFIAVNLFLAYVVIRYRSREGLRAVFMPDHPALEKWLIIGTGIGIIGLLAPGLYYYAQAIRPPADAMVVEIIGFQWGWSYRYPGADGQLGRSKLALMSRENPFGLDLADPASQDDIVTFEALHLPVGKPVHVRLRAQDVVHSLYIPQFRMKQDSVPGMVTQMWFVPTKTGTYEGACAEYCGLGHFAMRAVIVVQEGEAFETWLHNQPNVAQARAQQ